MHRPSSSVNQLGISHLSFDQDTATLIYNNSDMYQGQVHISIKSTSASIQRYGFGTWTWANGESITTHWCNGAPLDWDNLAPQDMKACDTDQFKLQFQCLECQRYLCSACAVKTTNTCTDDATHVLMPCWGNDACSID